MGLIALHIHCLSILHVCCINCHTSVMYVALKVLKKEFRQFLVCSLHNA